MNYNEYDEFTTKLAEEIVGGVIEKEAKVVEEDNPNSAIPRNRYKGFDTTGTVLKRSGVYGGTGALTGAALGALVGKKSGNTADAAKLGALLGLNTGLAGAYAHTHIKDNKATKKRYADDPKALLLARLLGIEMADKLKAKRDNRAEAEKEASIEDIALEKAAEYYEYLVEEMNKEASIKGTLKDLGETIALKGMYAGDKIKQMAGNARVQAHLGGMEAKDMIKKHPVGTAAAALGTAAAIGGAAYGLKKMKNKPSDKEIAQKAAEMIDEAEIIKQAAAEAFEEAQMYIEAAELALNELGYGLE